MLFKLKHQELYNILNLAGFKNLRGLVKKKRSNQFNDRLRLFEFCIRE